jgi:hypothetical protein
MLEFVLGYSAGQRSATRAASLARSAAAADGTITANRVEELLERIDSMAMILRAMWSLLEEQGLTAEQLTARIEELDRLDGQVDGQVRRAPVECPSCQSKMPADLARCQYCGADMPVTDRHPLHRV